MVIRAIALFFALSAACSADTLAVERVVRVVDGDTLIVDLTCEIPVFCKAVPVRVLGVDTPEIHGKCADERVAAQQARRVAQEFVDAPEGVSLQNVARDKYFRVGADVRSGRNDLKSVLISRGVAREYSGGTKQPWCK